MSFEMKVEGVFRLSDGSIAFIGRLSIEIKNFINECPCELLINGNKIANFKIKCERMPGKDLNLRSLCTWDSIQIPDFNNQKDWILKCFCDPDKNRTIPGARTYY